MELPWAGWLMTRRAATEWGQGASGERFEGGLASDVEAGDAKGTGHDIIPEGLRLGFAAFWRDGGWAARRAIAWTRIGLGVEMEKRGRRGRGISGQ